ncbi:MAG: response regulator transcription factor [Acidimicrobiales bacterium]
MATATSILVVDDEGPIRKLISKYVEAEGWAAITATTGVEAVAAVRERRPDVVILDVVMPELDGIEALRQIRSFSDVYVIMLTARAEETDRLIGLAVGADDYLSKPFSPRELVARIKAVLRRPRADRPTPDAVLGGNGLDIDVEQRRVRVDDAACETTALEFDLLVALAEQPGRVFSRRQLLERVWGWDYIGDERVVDVHVRNLRKALGDNATNPRWIGTVRNVGYRFVSDHG